MRDVNRQIKEYLFDRVSKSSVDLAEIAREINLPTSVALNAIDVDSDSIIDAETFLKFQEFFNKNI